MSKESRERNSWKYVEFFVSVLFSYACACLSDGQHLYSLHNRRIVHNAQHISKKSFDFIRAIFRPSQQHKHSSVQVDSIVSRNMVRVLKQDFNIAINVCGMKNRILIHLLEAEIWQTIPNYCVFRMVFSLLEQKRTHIYSLSFTYWRQNDIIYDDDDSGNDKGDEGNQRWEDFVGLNPQPEFTLWVI